MKLVIAAFLVGLLQIVSAEENSDPRLRLDLPSVPNSIYLSAPLPSGLNLTTPASWVLKEIGTGSTIPVDLVTAIQSDGTAAVNAKMLIAAVEPALGQPNAVRHFRLSSQSDTARLVGGEPFHWIETDAKSLGLWEGPRPIVTYNFGVMSKSGVPADRNRSTYLHPIYGLDGEILTDDFPVDHFHHRGLFWAWPHVRIDGKKYDLWDLKGIEQRFERWLTKSLGESSVVLGVENGWYVGERKVMQERIWFIVYRAAEDKRIIDVRCTWIPLDQPITLAGAEGKSYGGMTLRYAPRTNTVITTRLGHRNEDLAMTRLPWADLSAQFGLDQSVNGIGLMIDIAHPDFPPTWLTRHYGALCVGWPGVDGATFPVGQPIQANYRLVVHRGGTTEEEMAGLYQAYTASRELAWTVEEQR